MTLSKSNSSASIAFFERLRYLLDLFLMRWRGRGSFDNQLNLDRILEYEGIAAKYGINLREAHILEIGVGQRPYLGISLYGLGFDYRGVDLDLPIFPPSFFKFMRLLRFNGLLRLLKTLIRYYLFDRSEYFALFESLGLNAQRVARANLFIRANAAKVDLNALLCRSSITSSLNPPLVVISESVFEHIPSPDLLSLLQNIRYFAESSDRTLLILTRPTIWTGICGSHLTEWYHHNVYSASPKRSQPWEHLRLKRYIADTYLNKLSRAEFRELFDAAGYSIIHEAVQHPNLGASILLDPSLRSELSAWPDEELLSNEVMFELVPKHL